ncbi:MAG TPA: cysteine synthase A [Acetomicrobium sp.]|uniref:cysteine synthase A n=1 Tax=Acetomicrobium sp. TaxID=1872099 RepID=UPI002B261252|nr:cysteine synthase A [Acetomicrobium sp.]HPT64816.1 cysteine synthase A [Acetomicrobium sp.]HXK99331.1 cysteine synthase A [Acetomicrobium sp.]
MSVDEVILNKFIGRTPGLRLPHENGIIFAKLEGNNVGGSIKDRAVWGMLKYFEQTGRLKENTIIVEPTSGNTGIALAMFGAALNMRVILVMPESMSLERRAILAAYGAKLELTPAADGMIGAIKRAEQIVKEMPGAVMLDQFSNPGNPWAHMVTTAPEILLDVEGLEIAAFVAGVGTGGTLTGVGKVLKKVFPNIQIVAVEPAKSSVLSRGPIGPHAIQGIGAGFIPKNLDLSLVDQVVKVSDEDAIEMTRYMAREKGLFLGISSGANLWAAGELLKSLQENSIVVTVAPDRGDKYLSTSAYKL